MADEQAEPHVHVIERVEVFELFPVPGPNAWGGSIEVTPPTSRP